MASGFVTNDGKDLDSRYLGINAKAASASKADSATTATTATNVTNKGRVVRNGSAIKGNINGNIDTTYWTATSDGIVYSDEGRISVNKPLHSNEGAQIAWLNKGDKLYAAYGSGTMVNIFFRFAPVKIS